MGDAIRLVQLGTAVGSGSMAVGVECHGGLGGIGIGSAMVDDGSARKIGGCPRGHVDLVLRRT